MEKDDNEESLQWKVNVLKKNTYDSTGRCTLIWYFFISFLLFLVCFLGTTGVPRWQFPSTDIFQMYSMVKGLMETNSVPIEVDIIPLGKVSWEVVQAVERMVNEGLVTDTPFFPRAHLSTFDTMVDWEREEREEMENLIFGGEVDEIIKLIAARERSRYHEILTGREAFDNAHQIFILSGAEKEIQLHIFDGVSALLYVPVSFARLSEHSQLSLLHSLQTTWFAVPNYSSDSLTDEEGGKPSKMETRKPGGENFLSPSLQLDVSYVSREISYHFTKDIKNKYLKNLIKTLEILMDFNIQSHQKLYFDFMNSIKYSNISPHLSLLSLRKYFRVDYATALTAPVNFERGNVLPQMRKVVVFDSSAPRLESGLSSFLFWDSSRHLSLTSYLLSLPHWGTLLFLYPNKPDKQSGEKNQNQKEGENGVEKNGEMIADNKDGQADEEKKEDKKGGQSKLEKENGQNKVEKKAGIANVILREIREALRLPNGNICHHVTPFANTKRPLPSPPLSYVDRLLLSSSEFAPHPHALTALRSSISPPLLSHLPSSPSTLLVSSLAHSPPSPLTPLLSHSYPGGPEVVHTILHTPAFTGIALWEVLATGRAQVQNWSIETVEVLRSLQREIREVSLLPVTPGLRGLMRSSLDKLNLSFGVLCSFPLRPSYTGEEGRDRREVERLGEMIFRQKRERRDVSFALLHMRGALKDALQARHLHSTREPSHLTIQQRYSSSLFSPHLSSPLLSLLTPLSPSTIVPSPLPRWLESVSINLCRISIFGTFLIPLCLSLLMGFLHQMKIRTKRKRNTTN